MPNRHILQGWLRPLYLFDERVYSMSLDPFKKVRKTNRKSKDDPIPSPKKETLSQRKLRLQQELAEIENQEQASNICNVIERVAELTVIINAAKDAYRELDDLVEELVESGETSFETSDGTRIELVDNFDGKNKAWKSVAFQRYSAKLV